MILMSKSDHFLRNKEAEKDAYALRSELFAW